MFYCHTNKGIDYYKSNQNDCYKFKCEKKERKTHKN